MPESAGTAIAAHLIPKGHVYVSGGVEKIEFTLADVQVAFDLTDEQMIRLVAEAMNVT